MFSIYNLQESRTMSIISKVLTIFLFAIAISSCATNRNQYSRIIEHPSTIKSGQFKGKALACIAPRDEPFSYRNKTIRTIKSDNHPALKFTVHKGLKNNNSISFKNRVNPRRNPGKGPLISDVGKSANSQEKIEIIKEQVKYLQQVPPGDAIIRDLYDLFYLGDSLQLINGRENSSVINRSSGIILPLKQTDNLNTYLSAVFKNDDLQKMAGNNSVKPLQSQKRPFRKSESLVYLMALLAGFFALAGLKSTPEFSRKISQWATMNPWKTRSIITGIQLVMATGGILLGERLDDRGTHFSDLSNNLLVGAFLTSALLYPVRKSSIKFFRHTLLRQKTYDLALFLSGFMLMVNVGNQYSNPTTYFANLIDNRNLNSQHESVSNNNIQAPAHLVLYQNEKQLQDKPAAPQKNGWRTFGKILLTLLAAAAGCGLGYLLLLLSCNIACSGMEGLAYVVLIGGGILIIGSLIWVIKKIFTSKKRKTTGFYKV